MATQITKQYTEAEHKEHMDALRKSNYAPKVVLNKFGKVIHREPSIHPNMKKYAREMNRNEGQGTQFSIHNRNTPYNKRGKLIRPYIKTISQDSKIVKTFIDRNKKERKFKVREFKEILMMPAIKVPVATGL